MKVGDGGYPAHEQLEQAAERTLVNAPVPKPKDPATDPHARKHDDSNTVTAWRERGLTRLRVRGKAKVRCVLLLHTLAHNLMRIVALAPPAGNVTAATRTFARRNCAPRGPRTSPVSRSAGALATPCSPRLGAGTQLFTTSEATLLSGLT